MKEQTWERHSNPWSVWTRVLTNPLVYLPAWNQKRVMILAVTYRMVGPPRLETQLAASGLGRRLVFAEPSLVPAPARRLPMGDAQRSRRANMD
jgi:hypothetical protein